MPSFRPPLSHTSHVSSALPRSGESGEASYISLDFFLTFQPEEDQSGSWEIWTDIPALHDATGGSDTAHGEWHAIPFKSIVQEETQAKESANLSEANLITLSAPASVDDACCQYTLRANAVIYPVAQAAHAYTYRRVLLDGNIQWLGGEGTNGVIQLGEYQEGPKDLMAMMEEDIQAGRHGFGLVLDPDALSPSVTDLSTSLDAKINLALLSSRQGPLDGPFSTVVQSTITPSLTATSSFTILVRSNLECFDAHNPSAYEDLMRLTAATPGLAIDSALQGVPTLSQRLQKSLLKARCHEATDSIVAFDIQGSSTVQVVLWAGASNSYRYRTVEARQHDVDKPTFALISGGSPLFLPSGQQITLRFPPGATAVHLLDLIQPDELPLTGGESLWVSARTAAASVVNGPTARDDVQIADILEQHDLQSDEGDACSLARTDATPELDGSDTDNVMGNSENASPDPGEVSSLVLLLNAIGRLLSSMWLWLSGSVPAQTGPQSPPDSSLVQDDGASESEAETPLDERTPLLQTPRIRRTTPSSDTGPPTTPIRSKVLDGLPSLDRLTHLIHGTTTAPASLRYSFTSPPPHQLLFVPQRHSSLILEAISLRWRTQGSTWSSAAATETVLPNGFAEVTIEESGVSGEHWEIEVQAK